MCDGQMHALLGVTVDTLEVFSAKIGIALRIINGHSYNFDQLSKSFFSSRIKRVLDCSNNQQQQNEIGYTMTLSSQKNNRNNLSFAKGE